MVRFNPILTQIAVDLLQGLLVCDPTAAQITAEESLIRALFDQQQPTRATNLPLKEWQCLYWACEGKSIRETAQLLRISEASVKTYRARIKDKLQCKNLAQAIYQTKQQEVYLLARPQS